MSQDDSDNLKNALPYENMQIDIFLNTVEQKGAKVVEEV